MSNHVQEFSPDFTHALHDAVERRRLMPIITAALRTGFPEFIPESDAAQEEWANRPHDDFWHPSTHSTWDQRKLFLYLARPDTVDVEDMDTLGVEAVTSGKFWHSFYQTLLGKCSNVLVGPEIFLESAEHRLHGHCDGELADDGDYVDELLEIKTINEFQFPKITSDKQLKALKPGYYGQAQDYLFMRYGLGRGTMRFLLVYPSFPFPKNEFTVKANPTYQRRRMQAYADAWGQVQAYRAGEHITLAEACCMPTSGTAKVCEMRFACPVGRKV